MKHTDMTLYSGCVDTVCHLKTDGIALKSLVRGLRGSQTGRLMSWAILGSARANRSLVVTDKS